MRYSELRNIAPGVSQRMLTLTLQQLHRDGLITRTAYAEVPPRVECALTKLGESHLGAVLSLSSWAAKNHETVSANRKAFDESMQTA